MSFPETAETRRDRCRAQMFRCPLLVAPIENPAVAMQACVFENEDGRPVRMFTLEEWLLKREEGRRG